VQLSIDAPRSKRSHCPLVGMYASDEGFQRAGAALLVAEREMGLNS